MANQHPPDDGYESQESAYNYNPWLTQLAVLFDLDPQSFEDNDALYGAIENLVRERLAPGRMEEMQKLNRDLRGASQLLGRSAAKFLVDFYYQVQRFRTISASQIRARKEGSEPNAALSWVFDSTRRLEANIQRALGEFARSYKVGRWAQSICGIGDVISAGLLAYVDITKAPTAGHIHRFFGLDNSEWLGSEKAGALVKEIMGTEKTVTMAHLLTAAERIGRRLDYIYKTAAFLGKVDYDPNKPPPITRDRLVDVLAVRPWNAKGKVLCYKLEECFVKNKNRPSDYYGALYDHRKAYEVGRNGSPEIAAQAAAILTKKKFRKETDARKAYEAGRLPPAHLHMRAMRWTGKLFLSHLQMVMYRDYYGTKGKEFMSAVLIDPVPETHLLRAAEVFKLSADQIRETAQRITGRDNYTLTRELMAQVIGEPPVPYVFAKCPGDHRHVIPIPNLDKTFEGKSLTELGA